MLKYVNTLFWNYHHYNNLETSTITTIYSKEEVTKSVFKYIQCRPVLMKVCFESHSSFKFDENIGLNRSTLFLQP